LIYILVGLDDFSIGERLGEIKKGLGDPSMLSVNTTILEGATLTPGQLRAVTDATPFLSEKRLVIVNGLLERFEPKARRRRQKAIAAEASSDYQPFVRLIGGLSGSTVLVLMDGDVTGRNPLLKQLHPQAEYKSFPLLKNDQLCLWIKKRVKQQGGSISVQAVSLLARLVGSNLWIMSGEVTKLVTFTNGRGIEEDDVKALVSYSQQASVFAMVDAIIDSRAGRAQQVLQQLLSAGMAPSYLLFMLVRQVRLLVRTKELVKVVKSEVEIQNRLGLASEFAWRKTAEQAGRYSLGRLHQFYHKLLETDLAIKTGQYQPELALSILVADLCR
jgi:DNA polymerase-3 subunit delta